MTIIEYPYLPKGRNIKYVDANDTFLLTAKSFAQQHSLDSTMPTGAVLVREGQIIGSGTNGSDYHHTHECERVKRGIPTGQGYELCEGCHPKSHSEIRAITDAKTHGYDTKDADLYLWGHWWACENCWNAIIDAGIKNLFLMKDSEKLFNKNNSRNIVGKQFS